MTIHSYMADLALSSCQWGPLIMVLVGICVGIQLGKMVYNAHIHPLRTIPGPWLPAATTAWIRWQRWHGRLSLQADDLLTRYGSIVRISPNMVLLNDREAVEKIFARKDLDTSPKAIRALRVGGHDWTVTYPEHSVARQRRHPVMIASTTNNLKVWHSTFSKNIGHMVNELGRSQGFRSEDIVRHLRICTLKNTQPLIGGPGVDLDGADFPDVVGEYNFLVVWRLCLPEWTFGWLKYGPFNHARFRVQSSDKLFDLGAEVQEQAQAYEKQRPGTAEKNFYSLCTDTDAKYPVQAWTKDELSAEIAGQILAATETTSSALAFIYYELAKAPHLLEQLYQELVNNPDQDDLDSLKLLDACIQEGLRFRPPVALTGSRLVPADGLEVLGHYLPQGTVVTTQSLSMSRQQPHLFPNADIYDPTRWLDAEMRAERRRYLVPFGVGARRCPGGNMALYQMKMILNSTLLAFDIEVAPETTPAKMEPFEANGYRSRHDRCDLIFKPRL